MKHADTSTNAAPTPSAAVQTFPRLCKLLTAYYKDEEKRAVFYVKNGYFPNWAEMHRNSPDRGIIANLTPARLKAYKEGKITRAEAIKRATVKALKEVNKKRAQRLEKLDRIAAETPAENIAVFVTWTRSRVWGMNPTATVQAGNADTTGHASGCGYDKQSTAIAEALNASAPVLRLLYDTAEKALKKGAKVHAAALTSSRWREVLGYGSGYDILPYFEGGCGVSCITSILKACGLTLSHSSHPRAADTYIYIKEAQQ